MTATKGNSPRPRAVGPWLARKNHDAGRESTTMDWIRPWLCKHVNRRCLPYVLSPRPAALSRGPFFAAPGPGPRGGPPPQPLTATESAVHITARECTRLLSLLQLGAVWGAWGPTVSVIHYLYANNHRARYKAVRKPYTATRPTGRRTRKLCDKTHEQTIHDAVCSGALPPRWTFTTRSCLRPRVSTRSRVRRMGATGESAG